MKFNTQRKDAPRSKSCVRRHWVGEWRDLEEKFAMCHNSSRVCCVWRENLWGNLKMEQGKNGTPNKNERADNSVKSSSDVKNDLVCFDEW